MLACDPSTGRRHLHGYAYSNLTRTRTREGLFLLTPIHLDMFKPEPAVVTELQRMRSNALLHLTVPNFEAPHHIPTLHIVTHNIGSFDRHHADITSSNNMFYKADIIHMCEMHNMHLLPSTNMDFTTVCATTDGSGAAILLRNTAPANAVCGSQQVTCYPPGSNLLCTLLDFHGIRIALFAIYRSPRTSAATTTQLFQHICQQAEAARTPHVIVMGDFNIDMNNTYDSNIRLLHDHLMAPLQLHRTNTDSTTDANTCIDHIFTTMPMHVRASGTLFSYISDHYPCYMSYQQQPLPAERSGAPR